MAKIDLDSLNIEELAALRDAATEKLAQKVTARQAELEAELDQLSQYGKLAKKALVAPPAAKRRRRRRSRVPAKADEAKDAEAEAALTLVSRFRSVAAFFAATFRTSESRKDTRQTF